MSSPLCVEVTVRHDRPMKLVIISDEDRVFRSAFLHNRVSMKIGRFQSVHVSPGNSPLMMVNPDR